MYIYREAARSDLEVNHYELAEWQIQYIFLHYNTKLEGNKYKFLYIIILFGKILLHFNSTLCYKFTVPIGKSCNFLFQYKTERPERSQITDTWIRGEIFEYT